MINFNLMKTFISLYFHVDTKTQLNHFSYISKEANFEVLQFYPLKMNLVLEIQKMMVKEIGSLCY
jgi:hypothetical protein